MEVPMDVLPAPSVRTGKRAKRSAVKKKAKKRRKYSSGSSPNSSSSESSDSSSGHSSSDSVEARSRPSVPQALCTTDRWCFMTEFDPTNKRSYMLMEMKGDRANLHYPSLFSGDVASYDPIIKRILDGNESLENFRFGAIEKDEIFHRYFSDKVKKAWNENPERLWRRKELKPFADYIELSNFALTEDDLKDESGNLSLAKCEAVQGGTSFIESLPEVKNRSYNRELGKDRHNIELWLKFVAHQDEMFLSLEGGDNSKKTRAERLTSRQLFERKMSILDKAISLNYSCVRLKIERLKIGMHLWDEDKWNVELREVEFKHVNDPEMWQGVLDVLESDTRRFNFVAQLTKMKVCLEKLAKIRSGAFLSHKPMANTEKFMASVILRRIRLLLKCGYTEKAIASAQAVCEFNFCAPESVVGSSQEEKRKFFEVFWDSGVARIGDEGAEGWSNSIERIKEGKVTTDISLCEIEQAEYEKAEAELCDRVGSKGLKLPYRLVWIEIEKLRNEYQWRPIRDLGATFDDRERAVTYQDIEDVLYTFSRPVAIKLLFSILEEFGAIIYGQDSLSPATITQQLEIFPDLFPRLKNFDMFVKRFLDQLRSCVPEGREHLLSSELLTCFNFLKINGKLDDKTGMKIFRAEAKNLCSKQNASGSSSFMATFVEIMRDLGDKQVAKTVAQKFLSKNIWFGLEVAEMTSLLRLANVFISTCDDETEKRRHIAGLICEGKIADVPITDAIRIEKRINLRLRELLNLTTATESWDGSVVDLAATLAIQFSYYFAPPSERMQNLKRCYSTLCRIMDAHPQKQCTKKYLELLQMHLKNNPCDPARALIEASAVAHQKCPTDISILKTYIDANAFGTRVVHLRKLLQSNVKDERVACCRAYGSVYLELLLHRIMLEKTEVYSAELHRLRAAVKNASESVGHRDDTFWRLLLLVENDRKDARRASEAFYLAYADFPWSKALIMDYKDVKAGEHEKLLDALAEKKLRIRCEHEEIAMLVH